MNQVGLIAAFTLRESLRRRVFTVVAILTVVFLGLYGLGLWRLYADLNRNELGGAGVRIEVVAAATVLGLAMFATLFLGTVLAVFLTLGAVRGDAERGLLQPLLVRPLSRRDLLLGRYVAAAGVCALYVAGVFLAAAILTWALGGWWPDRILGPTLGLMLGVAIIAALSLAGSVFLSANANGIAIFMVFGAGLVAGILGQIGDALSSGTLQNVSTAANWLLPFEGLYQAGLSGLTADTVGFTRFAIDLGPFGGAHSAGPGLWLWALVYLGLVGAWALRGFARRDL
jgi:Cu-processing system permease protein